MAKHKNSPVAAIDFNTDWQYAPAPESRDHVKIKERYELFIGGKWVAPTEGKYFNTINPANEEKLAEIAEASAKDVDKAVRAAREAYDKYWNRMRPQTAASIFSGLPA
jgi:aldehyde dehydrogenase (NAD+)